MAEAGTLGRSEAGPGTRRQAGRPATAGRTAPLIALEGVSLYYGRHAALREIDLRIVPGERVAFVGANGSGKSTLLRVLHGLLPPSAGVRRLPLSGDRPLRFAMLFQRPFLLRLSVLANLRLALWLGGWRGPAARERCWLALQRVGLATEASRPARALSGGQQQRLALARAWALQPDVLLLDEPTASLDPSAKREVEQLLSEFAEQGTTLLMASHNLGQVKRLAQRVVYLEHGRILADAPLAEFFGGAVAPEAQLFLKGELPW